MARVSQGATAHAGRVRSKRPKFPAAPFLAGDLHLRIARVLVLPRKTGSCRTAPPSLSGEKSRPGVWRPPSLIDLRMH